MPACDPLTQTAWSRPNQSEKADDGHVHLHSIRKYLVAALSKWHTCHHPEGLGEDSPPSLRWSCPMQQRHSNTSFHLPWSSELQTEPLPVQIIRQHAVPKTPVAWEKRRVFPFWKTAWNHSGNVHRVVGVTNEGVGEQWKAKTWAYCWTVLKTREFFHQQQSVLQESKTKAQLTSHRLPEARATLWLTDSELYLN